MLAHCEAARDASVLLSLDMSCSYALKAVGSRAESSQQQDEALAIQLLRRKFAHLGQSQKASRQAVPPLGLTTSIRGPCRALTYPACMH